MTILDVSRLEFVLFLSSCTNGILAALAASSGRRFPGAWLWVTAQFLMAVGAGADVLRPVSPLWVPIILGNTAYLASGVCFLHSVWTFRFAKAFPKLLYALAPLTALVFLIVMHQSYAVRVIVYAALLVTLTSSVASLILWRVERPYWFSSFLTALPFLLLALASLFRIFYVSIVASTERDFTGLNEWYMGGALLVANGTLFGYFILAGVREEQMVAQKDAEIERRNRIMMESNRAKDLFFSIIAHDLRGPIGGSARYVRKHLLGKMTGLEAKYAEVETVASALEKTNEFLEKLLWWSRAQLNDWKPDLRRLNLEHVIEQSVALVRSAAELKEIKLVNTQGPFPEPIADAESVMLILGNLLSNAVKFTLPGRTVRVEVGESTSLCRISVVDEGVGMDQATIDRLFRIEDKLTTHGTSGERGSGLGLLLSQSLADRNGGGITIESRPSVGTEATLWLPMPTAPIL